MCEAVGEPLGPAQAQRLDCQGAGQHIRHPVPPLIVPANEVNGDHTRLTSHYARFWLCNDESNVAAQEDLVLIAGHKQFGKRWKKIANRIGSRWASAGLF